MPEDVPVASAPDDGDQAMLAWFPSSSNTPIAERKPFTEPDLWAISDILCRTGKASWSRVPRMYTVLRIIDQLPAIEDFLNENLSDVWFPFSHETLPASFKRQAARCDFLEAQRLVLSKGLALEKEDGKHRHFSSAEDIPFKKTAVLGKGGSGYVDKVLSTISYREYARKLIPRGRNFRKDLSVLKEFEKELAVLKRLSHVHIVKLVGSYTDPRFVSIIMLPVADYNLKEFLAMEPLPSESLSFLRTFFGCLTAALKYLHENRIRHKDIKPQNVLVKSHQVFLTDFGTSRDWSDLSRSTTHGPTTGTTRYFAPELAACKPRNSSADIWSLGCVFLEIWTVLCGHTVSDLHTYMTCSNSCSTCYCQNTEAIWTWCSTECSPKDRNLSMPYDWIKSMLVLKPEDRCNAQTLFDHIGDSNSNAEVSVMFTGLCCLEDGGTAESVQSSDLSDIELVTTPTSSKSAQETEVELEKSSDTSVRYTDEIAPEPPAAKVEASPDAPSRPRSAASQRAEFVATTPNPSTYSHPYTINRSLDTTHYPSYVEAAGSSPYYLGHTGQSPHGYPAHASQQPTGWSSPMTATSGIPIPSREIIQTMYATSSPTFEYDTTQAGLQGLVHNGSGWSSTYGPSLSVSTSQIGEEFSVRCECGLVLTGAHANGNLTRHQRSQHCTAHRRPREPSCEVCGQVFLRSDALLNHKRRKHGAPFGPT